MKYKHIIFDYGNVLGTFDPQYILNQFCNSREDVPILYDAVFEHWQELDEGTADYATCIQQALSKLPERLHPMANAFFQDWYRHCPPIEKMWEVASQVKQQGASVYLLSNASSYFAEHALEVCDILKEFDGILFSGPNQCAKPDPVIYNLLFDRFQLKPEECFFIDDNAENIKAAKNTGMDGIVFDGNVNAIKERIGL